MSGDIAGFYNARRDEDRAREAGEDPGVHKDAEGVIAEIRQAVAAGELVMAPTDSQQIEELEELEERVAELERQRQAVLDYVARLECLNCEHVHNEGECGATIPDGRDCRCTWGPSQVAVDIRDLLREQQ